MWPYSIISDLYTVAVFFTKLLLLKLAVLTRPNRITRTKPTTNRRRQFVEDTYPSAKWVSSSSEKEEECAVCLSEFMAGEDVRKLGCSHSFHKDCVDKWLFRADDRKLVVVVTCPLCRRKVDMPAAEETAVAGGGDGGDWGSQQFVLLLTKLRGDNIFD